LGRGREEGKRKERKAKEEWRRGMGGEVRGENRRGKA